MANILPYSSEVRTRSYDELLYKIFLAGACNRAALFSLSVSKDMTYYNISKALRNEHIRIGEYKEKYGVRTRSQKFFVITGRGVAYLSTRSLNAFVPYLPYSIKTVIPFEDNHSNSIAFATRCGNTLLMALHIDASLTEYIYAGEPLSVFVRDGQVGGVSVEDNDSFPDEFEDVNNLWDNAVFDTGGGELMAHEEALITGRGSSHLSTIKKESYQRMVDSLECAPQVECGKALYFFARKEMHDRIKQQGEAVNIAYGSYTGMLVSKEKSLLLYHAKHDGMAWNNTAEMRNIATMRQFSNLCSPWPNVTFHNACAALLIYDPKNFKDILLNKWNKRKTGTVIGKHYQEMYLVPLGVDGESLLQEIMFSDIASKSIAQAKEKFGLIENGEKMASVFPLMKGNHLVFNGATMSYRTISVALKLIQAAKERGEELSFFIVCYAWQQRYYYALWPDTPFFVIDQPAITFPNYHSEAIN